MNARLQILLVALLIQIAFAIPLQAQDYEPITMVNCGVESSYTAPPERAVTMNQAATEVMLALGLENRMVGTAYLDDQILPQFEEAYASVPVLSDQYPAQEILFAAEPDFVYGSYSSAFGEEAAGSRELLAELGIGSYVSPMACADRSLRPQIVEFEDIFGEIRDIGAIFGVSERAEAYIAELQAELDEVQTALESADAALSVFWFDSGTDTPYVGACCGAPGLIMRTLGLDNILPELTGSWAEVNWEDVVTADADVIVLIDASWDLAADKIALLEGNPAYAEMQAVQDERYVIIPFSYTTAGIRNVDAVRLIAEALYPDLFPAVEATPEATPGS
jgi:iron complex transport system substrate-binding protein